MLIITVITAVYVGFHQLLEQTIMNWSDHYQPSSLEEAQELAPYNICAPSYLPAEINPSPIIRYLDVWPDNSAELIFGYNQRDTTERWVEIRQWYRPSEQYYDPNIASLEKSLVVWLVGWDRTEEILGEVTTDVTRYETDGVDRWLVEIVAPVSLRGSVVEWTDGKTTYRVYSVLESEETVTIANSICSYNQTGDE